MVGTLKRTLDQVNAMEEGILKFVKVAGEYRWIEQVGLDGKHIDLVDESEYPLVQSAGTIFIGRDDWSLHSSYSMTLRDKGVRTAVCDPEHLYEIQKMMERPQRA